MKYIIAALVMAGALYGCAFHAPEPPVPADSPRVPVNATAPLTQGA